MARSFWKGKFIANNFVVPSYTVIKSLDLKEKLNIEFDSSSLEPIKILRRNHMLTASQNIFLKVFSPYYYIYNGYDFLKQQLPFNDFLLHTNLNLGSLISTREMNAIHKIKLTKAARIKKASTQRKITLKKSSTKSASVLKRKSVLSKKFKK